MSEENQITFFAGKKRRNKVRRRSTLTLDDWKAAGAAAAILIPMGIFIVLAAYQSDNTVLLIKKPSLISNYLFLSLAVVLSWYLFFRKASVQGFAAALIFGLWGVPLMAEYLIFSAVAVLNVKLDFSAPKPAVLTLYHETDRYRTTLLDVVSESYDGVRSFPISNRICGPFSHFQTMSVQLHGGFFGIPWFTEYTITHNR